MRQLVLPCIQLAVGAGLAAFGAFFRHLPRPQNSKAGMGTAAMMIHGSAGPSPFRNPAPKRVKWSGWKKTAPVVQFSDTWPIPNRLPSIQPHRRRKPAITAEPRQMIADRLAPTRMRYWCAGLSVRLNRAAATASCWERTISAEMRTAWKP